MVTVTRTRTIVTKATQNRLKLSRISRTNRVKTDVNERAEQCDVRPFTVEETADDLLTRSALFIFITRHSCLQLQHSMINSTFKFNF